MSWKTLTGLANSKADADSGPNALCGNNAEIFV